MTTKSPALRLFAWLPAIVLVAPIVALAVVAGFRSSGSFEHLLNTVLWDYVQNTLILVLGVCVMAVIWGLPSAWLVVRYEFPGRRLFRWALLLPMVMPAYVVAYIYTEIFDYTGVVQQAIRSLFEFQSVKDYWFFEIRSMGGAILVLSLVFSPYVYWISSLNFNAQCQSLVYASRLLNNNEWQTFYRVVLPLSRPALAVACSLVAMETIADFGTVSYFSVLNLTTAVYDTWLRLYDLPTAAKLACLLLLLVVVLVLLEQFSRRRIRYQNQKNEPLTRIKLTGKAAWLASSWCSLVVFLGFLLPMLMVVYYALRYVGETDWQAFVQMLKHTFSLALGVAAVAAVIAVTVQLNRRFNQSTIDKIPLQISSLGYAMPGTVLAIGVLIISTGADHLIGDFLEGLGFGKQGLLFSGTLLAMGYAFVTRFSAVAIGSVDAGISKIPKHLDDTALLFAYRPLQSIKKIFLPLLHNSILTAFMLVFLESMKELSAAILLRPFNVETLATYVYQYMSADNFEAAALPALVLVLAGFPAIWIVTAAMKQR